MKTLIASCLAACLFLACCAGCDESSSSPAVERVSVVDVTWESGYCVVRMKFVGRTLIDEKTVTAPGYPVNTATEYLSVESMGWKYVIDTQNIAVGATLDGLIYEATAEGVEVTELGWGVLPQNLDGSFVTDAPNLNMQGVSVSGHVVTDDRAHAVSYRTECVADYAKTPNEVDPGLVITINGDEQFVARP